jgi:ubiquinone/menaquinone biosynthesis C-methylase UbiE
MMDDNRVIKKAKTTPYFRCPVCKKKLKTVTRGFMCRPCKATYPVRDGIYDFYPLHSPFFAAGTDLQSTYEKFGVASARPARFENDRRKKLTLALVEGERCLEIGAAEGWMSRDIAGRVQELVCADIALSYLARAQKSGLKATFVRLDAHTLPFPDDYFDCVVLTEVIEHLVSPYTALEDIHRVLKPSGVLIISTPNLMTIPNILQNMARFSRPSHDAHLSGYDIRLLQAVLSFAGFKTIKIQTDFIHLPLLKKLFYFTFLQNILQVLLRNFGAKILIKAAKTEDNKWNKL